MSMASGERGKFITIEGTDGAGKSTQRSIIVDHLSSRGIDCIATREPGGTALGEAIRNLLLDRGDLDITPAAQLLLVFAARAQHLAEVIEPALARGDWVVCDRFTDATYAYQGAGGGLGFEAVATIEQWVQGPLRPDLTLLVDVPVAVGAARSRHRGADGDRFERLDRDSKERIRRAYLELARTYPDRIRIVDGSADVETVRDEVVAVIDHWIDTGH